MLDLMILALAIAFVGVAALGHILLGTALLMGSSGRDVPDRSAQDVAHAAIQPATALDKAA